MNWIPGKDRSRIYLLNIIICIQQFYRLCGGDRLSGGSHYQVESAFFLYFKRTETDFVPAFVYSGI